MSLNAFIHRHQLGFLRYVAYFAIILLGFHVIYTILIDKETLMIPGLERLYLYLRNILFVHSAWVIENMIGYDIAREGFLIRFKDGGGLLVDESCSAVKWFAHFLVMMLLFPGPWKHKLWFIPAGILITHAINIIRIAGLAVVLNNYPGGFDFYHDYVFRPFFYIVLFLMWVVWVEHFFLPSNKNSTKTARKP